MPDPLAIPVLNVLKILTPHDITSLSKEVSGTEKIQLTEILAEETGINKKNSPPMPTSSKKDESSEEEKKNSEKEEEKKMMAPNGTVSVQKQKNTIPKMPSQSQLTSKKDKKKKNRERYSEEEAPSSTNFFIREKDKMKGVEMGIKKIEILKLYKLSSSVDIQKGKSEEDLAKTGQSGILFNKRRF